MAYRDRPKSNWGAIVATVVAVPAGLLWVFVEMVGGTMGCEGNAGPCGPGLLRLLGGIAIISIAGVILGRLLNRIIERGRSDR